LQLWSDCCGKGLQLWSDFLQIQAKRSLEKWLVFLDKKGLQLWLDFLKIQSKKSLKQRFDFSDKKRIADMVAFS